MQTNRPTVARFLARKTIPFLILPFIASYALASPSTYKDVCTSGCTYSTVQAAIDSITDSSATKVYTVFIDSGVLFNNTSMTTNGKDYINFVGRGEGVSIVQATSTWFANVFSASTPSDFLDLSGSTNVTLRGFTLDARTNDPGTYTSTTFNGVKLENADRLLFDTVEIKAVNYAVWENLGTAGNLIEMFDAKLLATNTTLQTRNSTWHIFSSEIKSVQTGLESASDLAVAVNLIDGINMTIWGSHLHAESSKAGASGDVAALRVSSAAGGSVLAVIGTQLHLKIGTTNIGSATRRMFAYLHAAAASGMKRYDFVGSYLNYESPASMSQGRIGGIGYSLTNANNDISFVGGGVFDVGGSGGTYRADVVQTSSVGTAPNVKFAGFKVTSAVAAAGTLPTGLGSGFQTLNTQKGSVTLASGTGTVTLPTTLPDNSYSVAVSTGVNETIRVTGKATTGFTVTSSNGSSNATVDWIVVR